MSISKPAGQEPGTGLQPLFPKTGDLVTPRLPALRWEDGSAAALGELAGYAAGRAEAAVAWYLRARRIPKAGGLFIRFTAILAAAAAGILPMLAQISRSTVWEVDPAWSSVLLAVAAASIGLDRFFGYSSAWMRYIAAELRLQQLLMEFRLDWEAERALWRGADPDDAAVQQTLARIRLFVRQIDEVVRSETETWIREFEDSLRQIDHAARTKAAEIVPGGINLTVTNGDSCEAGWTLWIDGGAPRACRGRTAAVRDVAAGNHVVAAAGTVGGVERRAEAVVEIAAGALAAVQLTLT